MASLLVGVIVSIGFILLIVPGIVFACKLAFTPYLVVDRKMGVITRDLGGSGAEGRGIGKFNISAIANYLCYTAF